MPNKFVIRDNKAKYTKFVNNSRKLKKGVIVDVGIFEQQGLDLVTYAISNEFGLGPPERSFLRSVFDIHKREFIKKIKNERINIVLSRKNPETILSFLGEFLIAKIKQNIQSGIEPPNADSTVAKKGSSKPLIDTGRLITSITRRIRR